MYCFFAITMGMIIEAVLRSVPHHMTDIDIVNMTDGLLQIYVGI